MLELETRVLVAALVEYGRAGDLGAIRQAVAVMTVHRLAKVADQADESIGDTFLAWQALVDELEVQL